MGLRGFDSYEITLGDEMRGERASLGKSLSDIERDIRIKAHLLAAIEDCDISAFRNQGMVPGYVRSYARYLGMDGDSAYARFRKHAGLGPVPTPQAERTGQNTRGQGRHTPIALISNVDQQFKQSRFTILPAEHRRGLQLSLGGIGSLLALIALLIGLAYGGYTLLQNIQRVGFAPLPDAPLVVAEAPVFDAPPPNGNVAAMDDSMHNHDGEQLPAVVAATDPPPFDTYERDGPISAINPQTAGVFAQIAAERPDPKDMYALDGVTLNPHDDDLDNASKALADTGLDVKAGVELASAQSSGISLRASEEVWIRVREASDAVIFEGTLKAGDRYELPNRLETPMLKAGNAGGLYVVINGQAFGPLGRHGHIARNVSLLAQDVQTRFPKVATIPDDSALSPNLVERAEAVVQ